MPRVARAKALRDQDLDIPAQQFIALMSEELFDLGVDQNDSSLWVHDHNGVRGGLQKRAKLLFRPLTLGDVAYGAGHQYAFIGSDGTQTDFDGKFAAVLAQSIKLQAGSHRANARLVKESGAVAGMAASKTFRYQGLDFAAQQLFPRITEKLLHLRVGEYDFAFRIDHHHGVRSGLQKSPELLLRRKQFLGQVRLAGNVLRDDQPAERLPGGIMPRRYDTRAMKRSQLRRILVMVPSHLPSCKARRSISCGLPALTSSGGCRTLESARPMTSSRSYPYSRRAPSFQRTICPFVSVPMIEYSVEDSSIPDRNSRACAGSLATPPLICVGDIAHLSISHARWKSHRLGKIYQPIRKASAFGKHLINARGHLECLSDISPTGFRPASLFENKVKDHRKCATHFSKPPAQAP